MPIKNRVIGGIFFRSTLIFRLIKNDSAVYLCTFAVET
ncbi:hypothetical protein PORCRE_2 [Porphyromonas crevioricanis JCM 15906]|uniref:Uncharacterized protein n=1 Tax=Porphyromonas crevioricanis JCM 15906 TaxID=1305617 RepID=S4NAV0_9PORP|nr:hypothetical protein PORCRE_2 [Porphyromonas crevioricanis JCM 15906]